MEDIFLRSDYIFLSSCLDQVSAQTSIKSTANDLPLNFIVSGEKIKKPSRSSNFGNSWMWSQEPIGVWSPTSFTVEGILEHLNVTKDLSDYLWHFTRYGVVLLLVLAVMHISICLPI